MWLWVGDSYGLGAATDPENIPGGYLSSPVWSVTTTPSFAALAEPTGIYAEAGTGLSPGGAFCWRRWQATGRPQILVNAAKGATRSDQWTSGSFIDKAIANANWALRHPGATLKGIVWVQGANNAIQGTTGWGTDMTSILSSLRSGITGAANIPAVVGVLQPTAPPQATQAAWNVTRGEQIAWVSGGAGRYSFDCPSGPLRVDNLHLTTPGNLDMGERALVVMAPLAP